MSDSELNLTMSRHNPLQTSSGISALQPRPERYEESPSIEDRPHYRRVFADEHIISNEENADPNVMVQKDRAGLQISPNQKQSAMQLEDLEPTAHFDQVLEHCKTEGLSTHREKLDGSKISMVLGDDSHTSRALASRRMTLQHDRESFEKELAEIRAAYDGEIAELRNAN